MQTVFDFMINGTFISELKNRFLCEVIVNNEKTICYVPSSCHLGNFLSLQGKKVLLLENKNIKARTRYALFAMPYKKSHILLNTSMANKAVLNSIKGRRFSFMGARKKILTERNIEGYKCDLFVEDTGTIVEVKSVISVNETAFFPTVFSERSLNQFASILELLQSNRKVVFVIASLNPYVKRIEIDKNTEFYSLFSKCKDLGLVTIGCTVRLKNNSVVVGNFIPVISD